MLNIFIQNLVKLLSKPNPYVSHVDTAPDKPLGFISKRFESGRSGPGTISTGKGDPGGKSYGCHQLASKTGTLQAYLRVSAFKDLFEGLVPASAQFDKKWKEIARKHREEFANDQLNFIKMTHYTPVRRYADSLNVPHSRAINEALFSIGVQHGGANKIIRSAYISRSDSEEEIIRKLYASRVRYVDGLRLSSRLKASLRNRYRKELEMVLDLVA